ncbi:MAG: pilus assembly protein PilC [Comamonas sp.]|nr:pilus assembly protein PilC [Comamonas sp.]
MSHCTTQKKFQRSLLALAIATAFAPAWALDLADAPPGTVQPYVRPNVIISIDDSGSMNYRLDRENANSANDTKVPNSDGSWPVAARRMNVLKYALIGETSSKGKNTDGKGVFRDTTLLPTNKIRLSWQVMHNNGSSSGAGNVNSDPTKGQNTNSMRIMDESHRENFIDFVNNLTPKDGTPSHTMFSQADAYMRRGLHKNGPWASDPGNTGAPYLGCRRNYHIFMTDGRWQTEPSKSNKIGGTDTNADNNRVNKKLPDDAIFGSGTNNDPIRAKTQIYADTHNNTLADWAFYSWSTPLQEKYKGTNKNSTDTLYGTVEQDINYRKAPNTENFGKDFNDKNAVLDSYWNPKYNPATWPHMVTYTIGFSAMAYTWPDFTETEGKNNTCKRSDKSICTPSKMVPFGYDGSFPDLITGAVKWPALTASTTGKNSLDLWHAAINGRGRFYAVEKGEDLETAFREIFQQINSENTGETTTSAISGTNTSRDNVGRYTSKYEPRDAWKGYVYSEILDRDGNVVDNPAWNGNTAAKLDARKANYADRLVLSWKSEDKTVSGRTLNDIKGEAISFAFNNLSATQKSALNLNTASPAEADTRGSDRVDYIRGRTSHEGTTATTFRQRVSIQGDIVNSAIWYTSWPNASLPLKGYAKFAKDYDFRTPMLYVGGNDGMLHGFSAIDGEEKIAYVPKGAIPSLRYLTGQDYNNKHKFFVDGSPMTGDVDVANTPNSDDSITHTPDWRTMLVGTMGLGGKGYFVLDVTNPGFSNKPPRVGQDADAPSLQVPSSKPASNFNSTTSPSQLVVMDRTRNPESGELACDDNETGCLAIQAEERDIGHITAEPVRHSNDILRATQITRLNNNRWAVVLGNGYNSFNQRPVLLVQYLDGNKELLRIPAVKLKDVDTSNESAPTVGTGLALDNGLGAPRLVDLNGDDRMDIAYAGDNLGNLWKFDLTSYNASDWGVAFGGQPLFTATGPAALNNPGRTLAQPITVAPTVRANDRKMTVGTGDAARTVAVGGMMVAFGTGRNVARTDAENGNVQTLYSVLDNTRYRYRANSSPKRLEIHPGEGCSTGLTGCVPVPAPAALGTGVEAAKLVAQTINQVTGEDYASLTTNKPLNLSNWATKNGWYLDFPMVSERLLKPIDFYDGTNILTVYSQVPAKGADIDPNVETCDAGSVDEERQYRTFINIMDGAAPSVQLMTFSGIPDFIVARTKVHKGAHSMLTQGDKNLDIDTQDNVEELNRMPETTSRPSWRQMQ